MTSIDTRVVVARIADPSASVRQNAVRYIVTLLNACETEHDRLQELVRQEAKKTHEETGLTGFWFGADEAEVLRLNLVAAIYDVVLSEDAVEAVEVVRALLSDPMCRGDLITSFNLLRQIRSDEADLLVWRVLDQSAGYAPIRIRALEEVARRGLTSESQSVLDLCMHYDARTRAAARAAAAKLDLDVPPEARTADMLSGRIARFLERTAASTEPVVTPTSRWVRIAPLSRPTSQRIIEPSVTVAPADGVDDRTLSDRLPRFGRVVSEANRRVSIVDWDGVELELPLDSDRLSKATAADAVALLLEWRRARQARDGSGITQSWQPNATSWLLEGNLGRAEYLVGGWCFAAGEFELARTCVVPFLEATEDEDALFSSIRDGFALDLEVRMLDQFVEKRDYAEAVRFARRLQSPVFDGYSRQALANELAEQLLQRAADFTSLTLPSAASWAEVRRTLSRREQVEFLASRLRLLYCRQMSNPGGCEYWLQQGVNSSAWWREGRNTADATKVINPFVELIEMTLAAEEAIHLIPTLLSDDFVLGGDYPRFGFRGPMNLHRAAWVAGAVINEVLQTDAVDFEVLRPSRSAERARHVEALRGRLSKGR